MVKGSGFGGMENFHKEIDSVVGESDGNKVEIVKDNGNVIGTYYELSVEKVIKTVGEYVTKKNTGGSLNDMTKGVFSLTEEIYRIPNEEGIIRYQHPLILGKYIGVVSLEGFKEDNQTFLNLKKDLEFIANSNNPQELIKKFFPEHKKRSKGITEDI